MGGRRGGKRVNTAGFLTSSLNAEATETTSPRHPTAPTTLLHQSPNMISRSHQSSNMSTRSRPTFNMPGRPCQLSITPDRLHQPSTASTRSRPTSNTPTRLQQSSNMPALPILAAGLSKTTTKPISFKSRNSAENHRSYKTKICEIYMEQGSCSYGNKCTHAHSKSELRIRLNPPNHKTEPCKSTMAGEICAFGAKCDFAHNEKEMVENRKRYLQEIYPEKARFVAPNDIFQIRDSGRRAKKQQSAMRESLAGLMKPAAAAAGSDLAGQEQLHSALPDPLDRPPPQTAASPSTSTQVAPAAPGPVAVAPQYQQAVANTGPGSYAHVPSGPDPAVPQHVVWPNHLGQLISQVAYMQTHSQLPYQQTQYVAPTAFPVQHAYGNVDSAFVPATLMIPQRRMPTPQLSQMQPSVAPQQYLFPVPQMTTVPLSALVSPPYVQPPNPGVLSGLPRHNPFVPGMLHRSQSNSDIPHSPHFPAAAVPALRATVSYDQDLLSNNTVNQQMNQSARLSFAATERSSPPYCTGNPRFNGSPLMSQSSLWLPSRHSTVVPTFSPVSNSISELRLLDHPEPRVNRRLRETLDFSDLLPPATSCDSDIFSGSYRGSSDIRAHLLGTKKSSWAESVNFQRLNRGN